jgi:DNA-binding HxlR family transcriptional regulator
VKRVLFLQERIRVCAGPTDMTNKLETDPNCRHVTEVLSRLGDRWTLQVLLTLHTGPRRFNEVRRAVAGVSQQMLTRTFRILERDGMVVRTVRPTLPPQVEYSLTDLGRGLAVEGERLGGWALEQIDQIQIARDRYDKEHLRSEVTDDGRETPSA